MKRVLFFIVLLCFAMVASAQRAEQQKPPVRQSDNVRPTVKTPVSLPIQTSGGSRPQTTATPSIPLKKSDPGSTTQPARGVRPVTNASTTPQAAQSKVNPALLPSASPVRQSQQPVAPTSPPKQ
jgi:hypothetical protein